MGHGAATVEAVIISGPRRGEIIQLSEETLTEWTDEELELLNASLDQVIAALDKVSLEFRRGTAAMKAGEARI